MKLRSDSGESIPRDNRRKIEYCLVFPLRVASWAYASKAMLINLVSPKGEGFQLNLLESFLWEMASGKNSVEEIYCLAKQQFHDVQLSIEEICDMYRELEDHYCLILREIVSAEQTKPSEGPFPVFSKALKDHSISREDRLALS
jgi:hypothetical protein